MDTSKYIDMLEQACSKRELASLLFYKLYDANNESLTNQRVYAILKHSKARLQDELKIELSNLREMNRAVSEHSNRELRLINFLTFFEDLLEKEEEGESND